MNADTQDRELNVMRILDAQRDKVWTTWTEPAHIAQWWAPPGVATTINGMDLRPGGEWRLTMCDSDGRERGNRSKFMDVVKLERLAYKQLPEPGTEPVTFQTTVTFEDYRGKTRLQVTVLFPSAQARQHAVKKYNAAEELKQTVGRFEAHLATAS